jgi:iron complex transport system substrate-binding protein
MRSAASPSSLAWLVVLAAALALSACGGAPTGQASSSDALPGSAPQDPPSSALGGNLTDDCVTDFSDGVDYFPDKVTFDEAAGVSVTYTDTYKVVEVTPPGLTDTTVALVLVQCGAPAPDLDPSLADAQVIEVPVQRLASLTTTNLPHLDVLDAVERLAGVGTAAYVTTPAVVAHVEAADLPSLADDFGTPDLERLLDLDADLMILDGFGDTILDDVGRYVGAGIPTAINADFNEQTLLGRAEWLKFTALFLNAEAAATAAFDAIADTYRDLTALAAQADEQPTVLVNTPYEGTWFTPGGASFLANAIADAGGRYVFADDTSSGSLMLDIETVLDVGADAAVWLQAGSVNGSLDDLLAIDERFALFAAFQDGQVWAYDAATHPSGGNPVFELAYTRADLFLGDLVHMLHPELLPDHELVFFGLVGSAAGSG